MKKILRITSKVFIHFMLLLTLGACSSIPRANVPTTTFTLKANTPTLEKPTTTEIPPTEIPTSIPTETQSTGMILSVQEDIPTSGDMVTNVADNKMLKMIFNNNYDVYAWEFGKKFAVSRTDGLTAFLPRPSEITTVDGTELTYQGDKIDGLSKYSDGAQNLYILNKVPLEPGATKIALVRSKDTENPNLIYQLDKNDEIVSIQTAGFNDTDKPTNIASFNVEYGDLNNEIGHPADRSKLYTLILRGDKMLRFIKASNSWMETGQPFDKPFIEKLPRNYIISRENDLWVIKTGGKVWAIANPIYNDYWLQIKDLDNYIDITSEYRDKFQLGTITLLSADGFTKQAITEYGIFKSGSGEIIIIDQFGCQVGEQIYIYDSTRKEYITRPDALVYTVEYKRDSFGYRNLIQVQIPTITYRNPLEGSAVRLLRTDDQKHDIEYEPIMWSELAAAELRSFLTSEELALSKPEDIIHWMMIKMYIERKNNRFSKEGELIDPTFSDPSIVMDLKEIIPGQILCHLEGSQPCYGSDKPILKIQIMDGKVNYLPYWKPGSNFSIINNDFIVSLVFPSHSFSKLTLDKKEAFLSNFFLVPFKGMGSNPPLDALLAVPSLKFHNLFVIIP